MDQAHISETNSDDSGEWLVKASEMESSSPPSNISQPKSQLTNPVVESDGSPTIPSQLTNPVVESDGSLAAKVFNLMSIYDSMTERAVFGDICVQHLC